jgi:hypothetical protein
MNGPTLRSLGIASATGSALGGSWTVRLLSTTGRSAEGVGLTPDEAEADALRKLRGPAPMPSPTPPSPADRSPRAGESEHETATRLSLPSLARHGLTCRVSYCKFEWTVELLSLTGGRSAIGLAPGPMTAWSAALLCLLEAPGARAPIATIETLRLMLRRSREAGHEVVANLIGDDELDAYGLPIAARVLETPRALRGVS